MNPLAKFRSIAWLATLKLALARGIASGAILAIVAPMIEPTVEALPLFFGWALSSTLLIVMTYALGLIFPLFGLLLFFLVILVIVGDPLVYVFNRLFPSVLGVADIKPLNFSGLIVVYKQAADGEQAA